MKQAEQARTARVSAVKRNVVRWVIVAVAALGGVLLIAWIGGAFDGGDSTNQTPTTLSFETVAPTLAVSTVPGSTVPVGTTVPGSTVPGSTVPVGTTAPLATTAPAAATTAP
jgi:multidrug efflux pump subunit AcrA (membrane-fusion protein)